MTHVDILKYALALGEGKIVWDKTNRIAYISNVDIDTDEWLGVDMLHYDPDDGSDFACGTLSHFYFSYEDGRPKQDEIVQNLIDLVTSYIEANDDAEYEIREDLP